MAHTSSIISHRPTVYQGEKDKAAGDRRGGYGRRRNTPGNNGSGQLWHNRTDTGYVDEPDMDAERATALYDHFAEETLQLMIRKNHDYAEAWRGMRVTSYTDFILTKINRIKEIEDNEGRVSVSEGIDSNYMDIINYAVFGMIKTKNGE